MAKSPIEQITELLSDDAPERRIAAAIVLGELRAKSPEVATGLMKMLESDGPPLQRHALDALARIGANRRALSVVFPLLDSRDGDVRNAAVDAIASAGEQVIPMVKERLENATPIARRGLDAVLSRLGGGEAFTALLAGLVTSDEEGSRAAAVGIRQQIKDADGKTRAKYLAQTEKFIKDLEKRSPKEEIAPSTFAAAIKILGFAEDAKAIPTLIGFAKNKKADPLVRKEALIALRFALNEKDSSPILDVLVDAAESTDRSLAQTALMTLSSLKLPPRITTRLEKLVSHPDAERARVVIEHLARSPGEEPTRVLVNVLVKEERRRAEIAAQALETREDAASLLAKALCDIADKDRAWLVRGTLRKHAKNLTPAMRKKLLEVALERLLAGKDGFEAPLDVAREADAKATALGLRETAEKLRKKNPERSRNVLRLLSRSDHATNDDRYRLASLELAVGKKDTRPAARRGDEALRMLDTLLKKGFDVATALRKDRALDLEELYYVGFHFTEEGNPVGEELLSEVVQKGGRKKIGKMAKNKLALAEASA